MAPKLYMIDVSPPVRAVLLTEKALGIKLEYVLTDLTTGGHMTPEYIKLNPQHTVPTLVDDDGTVIADSHAIIAYLVGKYGKDDSLYPKNLAQRAAVDARLHFESGSVFPILKRIVGPILYKGAKTIDEEPIEGANIAYDFLNKFLEGQQWVAGKHVTIADLSLIASVTSMHVFVPINAKYSNLLAWIKRTEQLPFYSANAEGLAKFTGFFKTLMS